MKTLRLLLLLALATALAGCSRPTQVGRIEEDVRLMKQYQREADNGAFYERRQSALKDIRAAERLGWLLSREGRDRYGRALTQFHLVSATYFYTLGQTERAEDEMRAVDVNAPTTTPQQWLEYRFLSGYYSYGPTAGRLDIQQCADIARELAADDPYWEAESTVIAAAMLNADGDYHTAVDTLQTLLAPAADSVAERRATSPEVLCRACEQMSVAYAGLADKAASDDYRNQYLDLLETIREDKELESRSRELEERTRQLRLLMTGTGIFVVLFAILFVTLSRRWRRNSRRYLQRLDEELEESRQEMQDERAMSALHVERYKRDNVVRKTSLAIVTSIIPLIDRMRREVRRGTNCAYVSELADEVNRVNGLLTQWIQTRQGMVSLHVETFALQELFDILAKGSASLANQGLRLTVQPTAATVKADKALTLFMLNTLVGNAQKFTPQGGTVAVTAADGEGYVELSVADDGQGMTADEVQRILREKVLTSDSHGFGLLNCKGIIEKYRKTDDLFAVCQLGIESEKDKGTRVWFRLPKEEKRG